MDLLSHFFQDTIYFFIASIPLIVTFLQLKIFKYSLKSIVICLILNLIINIFYWFKLNDIYLALYLSIPYICSFTWIWAENVLKKGKEHVKSKNDSSDDNNIP